MSRRRTYEEIDASYDRLSSVALFAAALLMAILAGSVGILVVLGLAP